MTVIAEMVGVSPDDMPRFREGMKVLSTGFTGWNVLRTFTWDLPRLIRFVRELIARKRENPKDDILTALIQAEEQGDRLSEDELVAMVFLLIFAGHETTVHLITNGVLALLEHPDQLERLPRGARVDGIGVEEILRFAGPIHGTKPAYATEDVTLRGVTIPKGSAVLPLLGSANRDPAVFDDPEVFDIGRSPNKHLAFVTGFTSVWVHHWPEWRRGSRLPICSPAIRTCGSPSEPDELELQKMPLWHRYKTLPVVLE